MNSNMVLIEGNNLNQLGTAGGDAFEVLAGQSLVVGGGAGLDTLKINVTGTVNVTYDTTNLSRTLDGVASSVTGTFSSFESTTIQGGAGNDSIVLVNGQGAYPTFISGGLGNDSITLPYTHVNTESFYVYETELLGSGKVFGVSKQGGGDIKFADFEVLRLNDGGGSQARELTLNADVAAQFTEIHGTRWGQDTITVGRVGDLYLWKDTAGVHLGVPGGAKPILVDGFETLSLSATRLFVQAGELVSNPYAGQTRYGLGSLEFVTGSEIVQLTNLSSSSFADLVSHPEHNTSAAESSKAVATLAVTDTLLGTSPRYILTGLDASLFKISSEGVLTFAAVKDYERPVDANKDGVYEVSVSLTNAKTGYKVVKDLTVGVEFVPINGTVGADTLKGTAGYDTLDGLEGDDKLTGGTGLDTFLVSSGHDTILDFNALSKGATGSEILQVSAGAVADATLKAAWTATSDSFNFGDAFITTSGLAVDLSGVTSGAGWDVLNKGRATTITGSQYNDVLTGGTGNDTLLGGAGNDLLSGGKGADTLTGGAGADTFRFGGDTKADHITDFVSGTDRIELDHLLFKAFGAGQLAANQFGQGTAATTATQRIVYDQPTGNLWYDADGSGKGKALLMGVLDNHAPLTPLDFWVI